METEAKDPYNKGLGEIVSKLYKLREIEFNQQSFAKKYNKAKLLIDEVTILLQDKKNFILYRPFWEELHDRMVFYYDYLNELNTKKKLPLFRMTLHNEAAKLWLSCKNRQILDGPLIHFDTHDDSGIPPSSKYLLNKDGLLNENGINRGSCGQINYPVTCLLLTKSVNHIIWAMPNWVYDNNASYNQTLVCTKRDKFQYIREPGQKKDKFLMLDDIVIEQVKDEIAYKFYHKMIDTRIKMDKSKSWDKLSTMIDSNKFILDIDLDFFVCNGDKYSMKTYSKNFYDLESTGRVKSFPDMVSPRAMYDDEKSKKMIRLLNKEMLFINKRIQIFLNGLKTLKDFGIKPCCINISDSTGSFFSGNTERAVFTNEYTPKYFVSIIHSILISGLQKLYKI